MKRQQDENSSPEDHYIRRMLEIEEESDGGHEGWDRDSNSAECNKNLRIIICMSRAGSERLLRAQYLQSDVAFKRIVGFYEFELACIDRDANTSAFTVDVFCYGLLSFDTGVIFCRVFLNRQTALAHQRVFQEIESIVQEDTGTTLKWRHLHANTLEEHSGFILHWTADQHGGQAKGIEVSSFYSEIC